MVAPLVEAATSDLETVTADLIKRRKYAAREGSAERQLIVRELSGLRYSYKDPIIEGLDPIEWGVTRRLARMPGAAPQVCRSVNNASAGAAVRCKDSA